VQPVVVQPQQAVQRAVVVLQQPVEQPLAVLPVLEPLKVLVQPQLHLGPAVGQQDQPQQQAQPQAQRQQPLEVLE